MTDLAIEAYGPSWIGSSAVARTRPLRVSVRTVAFLGLAVLLAVLFVWPLVMLMVGALHTGAPGERAGWTLRPLLDVVSSPLVARATISSIALAVSATAIATLIAASLAYLTERTDLPFRHWVAPVMAALFATPGVFYAVAWSQLGNPYTGYLNAAVQALAGSGAPAFNIESWPGLILVVALKKAAFIYLFLLGPIRALNQSYEDASRIAGCGRLSTFFRVTLPLLAPALAGVSLIGLTVSLHALDIPLIIAAPAKIDVVAFRIYEFLSENSPPDYAHASATSVLLVLAVLGIYLAQIRFLGRRSYVTTGGKATGASRIRLGKWRGPLGAVAGGYLLVAAGFPLIAIVYASLQPYPGVYFPLSLASYRAVLAQPEALEAFANTAFLALIVGGATMTLALALSEAGRAFGANAGSLLRVATLVPLATPGLVIALAVVWAYVSVPGLREIYGTIWLMVLALIVVATPLATQQIDAATVQIGPELREAARIAGASPVGAYWRVVMPLIAPSFLAGWCVVGLSVTGNIEVPLLLGAPGLNTVSVEIYNLNSLGRSPEAAALLVLVTLAFIGVAGIAAMLLRLHGASRARPFKEAIA